MTKETTEQKKDEAPNAIDILSNTMLEFREEMQFFNNSGSKIAARTQFILRIGFTALIISSIILVIMIYQMAQNMSSMTTHMEDMYNNFGSMSQDMKEITETVDLMGSDITGMPIIAESMIKIDGDVGSMNGSIHGMNQGIASIDHNMVTVNSNTREMAGRLSNMKHSVNTMSHDVNQMSLPMNSGPMQDLWPK